MVRDTDMTNRRRSFSVVVRIRSSSLVALSLFRLFCWILWDIPRSHNPCLSDSKVSRTKLIRVIINGANGLTSGISHLPWWCVHEMNFHCSSAGTIKNTIAKRGADRRSADWCFYLATVQGCTSAFRGPTFQYPQQQRRELHE